MDLSFEAVSVFLVLTPGFLSAVILDSTVVRRQPDTFRRTVEALVFSFVIYVIASCFAGVAVTFPEDAQRWYVGIYRVVTHRGVLIASVLLAIALPLGLAYLINNDVHTAFLRRLGITNRTSRESIWLDVFMRSSRYVIVNLSSGRRLMGWPEFYSDSASEGTVYVREPAWIDENGQEVALVGVEGVLLVKKNQIDWIEFYTPEDQIDG